MLTLTLSCNFILLSFVFNPFAFLNHLAFSLVVVFWINLLQILCFLDLLVYDSRFIWIFDCLSLTFLFNFYVFILVLSEIVRKYPLIFSFPLIFFFQLLPISSGVHQFVYSIFKYPCFISYLIYQLAVYTDAPFI